MSLPVKDLEEESAAASAVQSGLWDAELCIFSSALEQATSLSAEAKQHVVGEYIGLQHRHLSLAKKLIGIQRTLQQARASARMSLSSFCFLLLLGLLLQGINNHDSLLVQLHLETD